MKVGFLIFLFVFLAKTQAEPLAEPDDEVQKFLKLIWDILQWIASAVHLDPDTGLNVEEFLHKYEYPVEVHNVTTSDGYILTLHRIPHGKNEQDVAASGTKPAVLFVAGIASSMDWLLAGTNSTALLLADLGYDVWLANTRGNFYTSHMTYTRKDSEFWDFSFHEKAVYDVPSSIDYILKLTGLSTITYVGHSGGTSIGLVLTSTKPEYNDKINLMVLLSPIAYMGNSTSPLFQLVKQNENIIKVIMKVLGVNGISYSPLISTLANVFCNDQSSMQGVCVALLSLFAGFDTEQMNMSKITVFFSNFPNGLSLKELFHYSQEANSGEFRQYDYGSVSNFLHYGSNTPPSYDISKVLVPLGVYYAKNDFMSSVLDVNKFIVQLPHDLADRYLIEYEQFNHLDFLTAKDVKTLLYDRVISVIQKYNPVKNP